MSESAAETSGTGTATGSDAPGTGAPGEDTEATGLLGGMLGQDDEDTAAQLAHWKDMARKHEKRAKENSSAAARLKEIEDANKTELQKAIEAQQAAERERDEAMNAHARVMAAAAHNLPVELIEHLGSGTDDEINERAELFSRIIDETAQAIAEQILEDMGVDRNGNGQPQLTQQQAARPVESLRAGSAPSGATPTSQEQWFRNLIHGS